MDYLSYMGDRTAEQRIQEVFQLLVRNDKTSVDLLRAGLKTDPSPIVRHECAYSLGELTLEEGYMGLTKAIREDPNKFVIHEAALALANLGVEESYTPLRELLQHENIDIVLTAEIAIERLRMKLAEESLEITSNSVSMLILDLDKHPEHRIQAAFLLLDEGSEESIDVLIQALHQETDPIVKHEIIFALGETASSSAILPLIEEMERDANIFVKHEAALALATLGQASAEQAIRSLLSHIDPDIVESAIIALERLLQN